MINKFLNQLIKKLPLKKKFKSQTVCRTCGNPIDPKSKHKIYCSTKCRNRYYYLKYLPKTKTEKEKRKEISREYYRKKKLSDDKEKIQCMICGKWFRQVGSHVFHAHNLTAREYRKQYGFDIKKGILPKDLKEFYGKQAIKNLTYKNLKKGKKFWFKKNDKKVGKYKRSEETLKRLKNKKITKEKRKTCLVCNKTLTNKQRLYCSKECRQKNYKVKYNKHKVHLF